MKEANNECNDRLKNDIWNNQEGRQIQILGLTDIDKKTEQTDQCQYDWEYGTGLQAHTTHMQQVI